MGTMQPPADNPPQLSIFRGEESLTEDPPLADNDQQVLGQYIPLLYHYNMLQDEDRVGAFREAIELLVQPEMHVLELGGGTGILSSFAARRGATVSCVERNPELVACARRFVHQNGLDQKITVIEADAAQYVPDRPVDVVICEMLHVGLLREKQVQVISSFKEHYQQAHGSKQPLFLPEASVLMVQPIQQSFDFAGYHAPVPLFQAPLLQQPRTTELALLSSYAEVAYEDHIPKRFGGTQSFTAAESGQVNAIRLVTQNVITIDVQQQRAITWPNQCLVLPIDQPFEVGAGQGIEIEFGYDAGGSIEQLSESIQVRSQGHRAAAVSTFAA